jgi:DNA-binding Xre family transcriptional regulator
MLKMNISRVLALKGIDNAYAYLKKQGYKHNKAYHLAYSLRQKVDLSDLEEICMRLNCTPNDLLEWNPSHPEHDIAGHALQSIRRKEAAVGLVKLVQGLPVEKMDEIEKFILETIGNETKK